MASNLARCLGIREVNVKATSPEGIGALGRKLGMAAQAIVLLE
jgi:2C-methyl-D-erythritol 2,4-cyclodiphosphate synthase